MTHKVDCLGHNRGEERAKNRERDANNRSPRTYTSVSVLVCVGETPLPASTWPGLDPILAHAQING